MTTVTDRLEAEIAELRNRVEALTREAQDVREAAKNVTRPIGMDGDGAAVAREKATHDAWKRKMGYGTAPAVELSLEEAGDEYERQVADALAAERAQKEAWQARERLNAERRAAASGQQPDSFQRAASSAARQREIERERRARSAEHEQEIR
jgi:hypothetical protein